MIREMICFDEFDLIIQMPNQIKINDKNNTDKMKVLCDIDGRGYMRKRGGREKRKYMTVNWSDLVQQPMQSSFLRTSVVKMHIENTVNTKR